MSQDSLYYKIGQMLICGFEGQSLTAQDDIVTAITQYGLGGVILFDKNLRNPELVKNITSPDQVKQLCQQLQNYAGKTPKHLGQTPLPLFISVDYEGGAVNRLKSDYGFPATISASEFAMLDDEQASTAALNMATNLAQLGFNVNFAPVVDLNCNPDNPIIGKLSRSFSADPLEVSKYAYLFATEHYRKNIIFTYKHFPGHGSSTTDSHLGFVDITNSWTQKELLPYIELFNRPIPCQAVMVGHVVNNHLDPTGLPATLSYAMLTTLLRQELNYQGLIIADDMQMQAITQYFGTEEAVIKAINAGADILIFGNQLSAQPQDIIQLIELIYKNVVAGNIAVDKIEQAFERITRVKETFKCPLKDVCFS